jgi:hypothetical protein
MNDPPSRPRSSSRATDPPSRRTSSSIPASIPASYRPRHRSPSPPPRIPYAPHRITAPDSVMIPISQREIDNLQLEGLANNPLRKKMKPPAPSWSGVTPSPSLVRSNGPQEGGNSYFPGESHAAGPSNSTAYYPGDNRGAGSSNSNYYHGDKEPGQVVRRKRGKSAVMTPLGKDHKRKAQTVDQITQGEKSARQSIPETMAWLRITVRPPQPLDVHQLMGRQLASGSRS